MGEESPHNDKYPLYREDKDDRSNLELRHNRHTAHAVTFSQIALSILILGITIAAFLYLILEGTITDWKRPVICFGVFLLFTPSAGKRAYLSWRHFLTAQFIEKVLRVHYTWEKYKLGIGLEEFRTYDTCNEELKQPRKKRRYCLFLDKIFKRKISKYIP